MVGMLKYLYIHVILNTNFSIVLPYNGQFHGHRDKPRNQCKPLLGVTYTETKSENRMTISLFFAK